MKSNRVPRRPAWGLVVIAALICLVVSFVLCLFAPTDLNTSYLWTAIGLFWGLNVFVLIDKVSYKDNWFTPEIVFLVPYWLYQLAYVQFWLMGVFPFTYPGRVFNYSYSVCFSTMMAVSGWAAFVLGHNILARKVFIAPSVSKVQKRYDYKTLQTWNKYGEIILYLALVSLVLIIVLAPSRFSMRYGEQDYEVAAGFTKYTILLLTKLQNTLMLVGLPLAVVGRQGQKRSFWPGWKIAVILGVHGIIWSLLGNRSGVVYPLSVLFVCLSEIARPLRFLHIVVLALIALLFLDFVGLGRSSQGRTFTSMLDQYAEFVSREEQAPILTTLEEQAASAQTLYAASAVVPDVFPYGLGRRKLYEIIGIIPFVNYIAQRFGFNPMSVPYFNSAYFLTYVIYQGNFSTGAGSTICADFYVDFGLIGVVAGLLLVGYITRKIQQLSRTCSDVRYNAAYFVVVAILLQMPRRGFVAMFSAVIWTLAALALVNFARKVKVPYTYHREDEILQRDGIVVDTGCKNVRLTEQGRFVQ